MLMLIPSLSVEPVAPVFLILSDPAKSTKWNLAITQPSSFTAVPSTIAYCLILIVKIACDLDDVSFINVEEVDLCNAPFSRIDMSSAELFTVSSVSPTMLMLPLSSTTAGVARPFNFGSVKRRSLICSL
jgi:hypothetical protein